MNSNRVYTVAQINTYIRNMFTQDFLLRSVTVKGEVSNCKYHSAGIFFTLKDGKAAIGCVMFERDRAQGLPFRLEDGQSVIVGGYVDVYERDGRYQLYAKTIEPDGRGDLYLRYEALKKELEERGMFDGIYKSPIPRFVHTIAVVTAPTGAVIHDIINVATRRNPHIRIVLIPAIVQGEQAPDSIVNGIRAASSGNIGADVMIVGRGGGSIEDLWAFNEEKVAQAIFDAQIPVISAVGHETDYTIADFVADLRAPTPSAAAELATFDYERFRRDTQDSRELLTGLMTERMERLRKETDSLSKQLEYLSPARRLDREKERIIRSKDSLAAAMEALATGCRQRIVNSAADLTRSVKGLTDSRRHRMELQIQRMVGLNPLERLSAGYARVADTGGHSIKSVKGIKTGDRIEVTVRDGSLDAVVDGVKEGNDIWL